MNGARAAALVLAALASGCVDAPAPGRPRPPLPLAATGACVPELPPARLDSLRECGPGRFRGCLASGAERVVFELRVGDDAAPRPIVLLVPILAGGASLLEQVALRVRAHGYDVAWCPRLGGAMKEGQRGADLDELFRRTVLHQRLLLRWLREDFARGRPQFALGISLGGMVATVLAAHEPGLLGTAICLSGGDVAHLIAHSSEPRVQRWRRWRLDEDGIGDDGLAWELAQRLHHEPLRFAPAVPAERVLLVEATLDTVIPRRHRDLLWEALGRPARYSLPLGHYSAALAIGAIVDRVARHFDELGPGPAAPPR